MINLLRRLHHRLTAVLYGRPLCARLMNRCRLPRRAGAAAARARRHRKKPLLPYPEEIYQYLQDQFRGSRQELENRLTQYVPLFQVLLPQPWPWPVVDLGCGRGDWLALLGRHNIPARGVDASREMIDACRLRGLDVVGGDALDYLQQLPENLAPAITAIQLIEHLPPPVLVALLKESFRVLRPGGLLLLETPNPENFQVSAYYFYLDPTHKHPIPPPLATYTMAAVGFTGIRVLRPEAYEPPIFEDPRLNRFFCVAMDYAAIGYKPHADKG
jgi:SAM-dependent methyltransferase